MEDIPFISLLISYRAFLTNSRHLPTYNTCSLRQITFAFHGTVFATPFLSCVCVCVCGVDGGGNRDVVQRESGRWTGVCSRVQRESRSYLLDNSHLPDYFLLISSCEYPYYYYYYYYYYLFLCRYPLRTHFHTSGVYSGKLLALWESMECSLGAFLMKTEAIMQLTIPYARRKPKKKSTAHLR